MQEQAWAQEPEFPVLTSTSSQGSGVPPAVGVGVGDCFVTAGGGEESDRGSQLLSALPTTLRDNE